MPCDPQVLVRESVCIQCGIPSGMQSAVLISLLCQIRDNGGVGGGGVWGAITGDINNQADLVAALAAANEPDLIVDNIDLDIAAPYNAAHGLGSLPSDIRCVLVFENGNTGAYVAGDEIDITGLFDGSETLNRTAFGASATNVWVSITTQLSSWGAPLVINKSGGTAGAAASDVHAKLYVWK